jgi:hypothetical protein
METLPYVSGRVIAYVKPGDHLAKASSVNETKDEGTRLVRKIPSTV